MYKRFLLISSIIVFIVFLAHFRTAILYKSSIGFCKSQHLKASGEFTLCQYNFMKKIDEKTAEKYMQIRESCYTNFKTQYETEVCTYEKMVRVK